MRARHLQAVPDLPAGRSDGGPVGGSWTLTDAELDQLEANAHRNGFLPAEVTLELVAAERARRAEGKRVRHALAGYPLGRPRC